MNSALPKVKLVYILAASHSGSTLTAMLLNSHKEICTVGELKLTSLGNLSEYRCSCRQIILDCEFWTRITSLMQQKGIAGFSLEHPGTDIRENSTRYITRLLKPLYKNRLIELIRDTLLNLSTRWRKNLSRFLKNNEALIYSIAEVSGVNIIVDSSKIGIRLKYLKKLKNVEVYVLRVIRDGRAVSLTYMDPCNYADASAPELRGGGTGKDRESEKLTFEQSVTEWVKSNREAENIIKTFPADKVFEIKYEELCTNTSQVMESIFKFIGVSPTNYDAAFKSVTHHVVGNGMRLDSHSQISLDDRWRTVLTEDQIKVFKQIGGTLNKDLGYLDE